MLTTIPSTDRVSADELLHWDPSSPEDWQTRMDAGEDNAEAVSALVAMRLHSDGGQERVRGVRDTATTGAGHRLLSPLSAIQGLDLRTPIMGMLPADSRASPWEEADMALVTLALDTEPTSHGVELDTEVSAIVRDMVVDLDDSLQGLASDSGATITVFSFSRFVEEQAGNLGAEIGILTSASIAILGIILWRQFRSVRDTGVVIVLTLLAIGATYGVSGIMRLEFNGAMNSIPILLLAIGVDYGLHVVLRYREELVKGTRRQGHHGGLLGRGEGQGAEDRHGPDLRGARGRDIHGHGGLPQLQALGPELPGGLRDRHSDRPVLHLPPVSHSPTGAADGPEATEARSREVRQGRGEHLLTVVRRAGPQPDDSGRCGPSDIHTHRGRGVPARDRVRLQGPAGRRRPGGGGLPHAQRRLRRPEHPSGLRGHRRSRVQRRGRALPQRHVGPGLGREHLG